MIIIWKPEFLSEAIFINVGLYGLTIMKYIYILNTYERTFLCYYLLVAICRHIWVHVHMYFTKICACNSIFEVDEFGKFWGIFIPKILISNFFHLGLCIYVTFWGFILQLLPWKFEIEVQHGATYLKGSNLFKFYRTISDTIFLRILGSKSWLSAVVYMKIWKGMILKVFIIIIFYFFVIF